MDFLIFMVLLHSMQYWLWRGYLKQYPEVFDQECPSSAFEGMMFWPQFLGIMRGKKPNT